jgi:hypothetical protein
MQQVGVALKLIPLAVNDHDQSRIWERASEPGRIRGSQ